jgi:NDP-sugar pyrophosphorylase family protein
MKSTPVSGQVSGPSGQFSSLKHLRGIVLAGGYAWSNSAFDKVVPRPLLLIGDQPLIAYSLQWLQDAGVRNVTVCVNHETRNLEARLRRHPTSDFIDLVYRMDSMPRGPAGCVRDVVTEGLGDTWVVVDGTSIPNIDLTDLVRCHQASNAALTVVTHYDAHGGQAEGEVPSGTYVIERRALNRVKPIGYVDIKENLIPSLYESGDRVVTYPSPEPSQRIMDLETYLSANAWTIQRREDLGGPSDMRGDGSVVAADALLVGPVLLGRDVRVMSGATIVGPASLGDGSLVASGAMVSRSSIWSHCVIGQGAVADRCLLADGAVVEPWTAVFGAVKDSRGRVAKARESRKLPRLADLLKPGVAARNPRAMTTNSGGRLA